VAIRAFSFLVIALKGSSERIARLRPFDLRASSHSRQNKLGCAASVLRFVVPRSTRPRVSRGCWVARGHMHLEAGMSVRLSSLLKRSICLLALYISFLPLYSHAQALEGSGGYAHLTGNQGVDGFNVGVAAWFTDRVALAADYDSAWDTSQIGVFQITPTGLVVSKSHLQNFLVGPRVSFPGLVKKKSNDKRIARLEPFAEVQFGVSHLNTSLNAPSAGVSQSASDTGFAWMLGGGTDYNLASHWDARIKLDLLRTHFAASGQSRFRLVLGLAYTISGRTSRGGRTSR
jgi:opacity protein-like surface antigen